jgi:hypothetical protein
VAEIFVSSQQRRRRKQNTEACVEYAIMKHTMCEALVPSTFL